MEQKLHKVVVTGILMIEGKVLLIKRSKDDSFMPGKFECPGGKIEFGEDPRIGLTREYMEETGLKVKVAKPIDVIHYISRDGLKHTVEIFFVVEPVDIDQLEVKLSEEHEEFRWADLVEIDRLDPSKEDIILNVARKVFSSDLVSNL